jgi:hypothetical protein
MLSPKVETVLVVVFFGQGRPRVSRHGAHKQRSGTWVRLEDCKIDKIEPWNESLDICRSHLSWALTLSIDG